MDRINESKKGNCSDIQEKIFGLIEDDISINSDLSLKYHVNGCPNCQNYLKSITILKQEMQATPSKELYPDHRILKNIIAYKKIKSGIQKRNQGSVWISIRAIFEFRIPVYQALSGVVGALLLFMYVSGNIISPDNGQKYIEDTGNQLGMTSSELSAIDSLNFSNSTRGQNAKEDSVLISFLVPTM